MGAICILDSFAPPNHVRHLNHYGIVSCNLDCSVHFLFTGFESLQICCVSADQWTILWPTSSGTFEPLFLQLALYTFIIASHIDTLPNSYFVYISIMVGECKFGCKTQFLQKVCLLMADHFLLCCSIGTSTLFIIAKHISILVADDD
jgi:hypothetical protein